MLEVLIGVLGGLLIGSTGIGSGSLIAPLLILVGHNPSAAVGASLAALVLSKCTATELHRQMGHLPGPGAVPLAGGGFLGVAITWLGTRLIGHWNLQFETVVKVSLGVGFCLWPSHCCFHKIWLLVRNSRNF